MHDGRRALGVALLLLLVGSAILAWPFHTAIAFAFVLAFLLSPVMERLAKRMPRPLAAGILLLLVALALVIPTAFVLWRLVQEAAGVTALLQDPEAMRASVGATLERLGVPADVAATLPARIAAQAGGLLQGLLGRSVGFAVNFITGLIVFAFLLYYLLVDGPRLVAFVRSHLPLAPGVRDGLLGDAREQARAILLGALVVSIIQGVVAGIGWWLLGFPAPIFWGFLMTILAVLPFLGPAVIMAPAGIFAILQGHTFQGVALLVYAAVVVGLVDNFARPFIVARGSDVHPAIVLLGTLGGLVVLGAAGFVLGPLLMGLVPPVAVAWRREREIEAVAPDVPQPE